MPRREGSRRSPRPRARGRRIAQASGPLPLPVGRPRPALSCRPLRTRRRPSRRDRSAGPVPPTPRVDRGSTSLDARTDCPVPADATATAGRTVSTNAWVVAVLLPWWATLSRSTRGNRSLRSDGSMPSSTSPISRNRRSPTWPRRTIETLLMPVPPSGGVAGTWPAMGHRTRSAISSTDSRSPAARRPRVADPTTDNVRCHAA